MQENQITFSDQMELVLFFAVFAIIVNWAAWQNGFFSFSKEKAVLPIKIKDVICIFALYIGGVFCIQYVLFWFSGHFYETAEQKNRYCQHLAVYSQPFSNFPCFRVCENHF